MAKKAAEKISELAITPRLSNFSQWFLDVIAAGKLAQHGPVRGTMVIRPNGFAVWEAVRDKLDARIKETGHVNAYFPCFIPMKFFNKEAEHVRGFAKECAIVTHHRLKQSENGDGLIPDPDSILEEPLVVRPTSEAVIWHCFSEWVESHRDLPLLINQWANVVRWEMRPRLFLRTSEFLWQEGHTCHATKEEAQEEAEKMLEVYRDLCENYLALPVIPGRKTPGERFAGADDTLTIESVMQNGWALQCGTSHFLGQNFPRAFDVTFSDVSGERKTAWGTSWGVSTRLIGGLIMTHSDDTGLVLPPRIAPTQVVIVQIGKSDNVELNKYVDEVYGDLKRAGVRVKVDAREDKRPGAKFFEWERQGVPLRLEIGAKDFASRTIVASARISSEGSGGGKEVVNAEGIGPWCLSRLDQLQQDLFDRASRRIQMQIRRGVTYGEMVEALAEKKDSAFLVPWAEDAANEEKIHAETKATIRCYPFEGQETAVGQKCFYSGRPATHIALFARAF